MSPFPSGRSDRGKRTGPPNFVCEPARAEDDAALRRLLRQALPGRVSVSLPREPDHRLAAGIEGDRSCGVVIRRGVDGAVAGCGFRAVREVWLGGQPTRAGYLGGLRADARVPHRRRLLAAAFARLEADRRDDETAFDLTSILAGNQPARRLLERGLPGAPRYTPIGELLTLTVRVPRRAPARARTVTGAEPPDATALEQVLAAHGRRFHGAPVWRAADLTSPVRCRGLDLSDVTLVPDGCVAVWDQRAFKQVRVEALSGGLARWRWTANRALQLSGRPTLPRPGTTLPLVFASHLAAPDDDRATWRRLLDGALAIAAAKGARLLAFGMPARHPQLAWVRRTYRPWSSHSIIYAVHRGDPPPLDDRLVWMEVAVL